MCEEEDTKVRRAEAKVEHTSHLADADPERSSEKSENQVSLENETDRKERTEKNHVDEGSAQFLPSNRSSPQIRTIGNAQ